MAQLFGLARLGRDAELRRTPNNDPVATLSLAFSYGRKDADGKRPTQWVEAALWGKRAEALEQYLTKGSQVVVTLNEVHIETFQGKNGEGHKLVGQVAEIELAGGAPQTQTQAPAQRPAANSQPRSNSVQQRRPVPNFSDMDDDAPFK